MDKKEFILCAAIKRLYPRNCIKHYHINDIYDIEIGYRHCDIFSRFKNELSTHPKDQGFYTSKPSPEIIAEKRRMFKGVNANVDFYSGLVYSMLGLPKELYTPIFAAARIVGWSAHRLEELKNVDKIIRPAYMPLCPYKDYVKMDDR